MGEELTHKLVRSQSHTDSGFSFDKGESMNGKIYELALSIQRDLGKNDWNECFNRAKANNIDISSPNACKKAYQRHCKALGKTSGENSSNWLKMAEERKRLNILRPTVESTVRQYTEKSVFAETIMNIWGKEPYHEQEIQVFLPSISKESHWYSYGDEHLDYTINEKKIKYDKEITKKRVWEIWGIIIRDTLENGYKTINVSDGGDYIEGASLRISQLLRITESMSQQSREYSDLIISCIKWASKQMPDVHINFMMVSDDNHGQLRLFNTKRDELPENMCILITNAVKNTIDTAHEYGAMQNVNFISADEIVVNVGTETKPHNVCVFHGHQYGRNENILENLEQRHGVPCSYSNRKSLASVQRQAEDRQERQATDARVLAISGR